MLLPVSNTHVPYLELNSHQPHITFEMIVHLDSQPPYHVLVGYNETNSDVVSQYSYKYGRHFCLSMEVAGRRTVKKRHILN